MTLQQIKQANEDFEWYPTTDEIIDALVSDINGYRYCYRSSTPVLDIGAGDGRVLLALKDKCGFSELKAVEISRVHSSQYDKNGVTFIGADFWNVNLMTKNASITFCNPPYKEFDKWMVRILTELDCETFYFVVPDRWKDKQEIQDVLEKRKISYSILGEFNFLNAERQARCSVNLIKFKVNDEKTPLDHFFEENFKFKKAQKEVFEVDLKQEIITSKRNLVEVLCDRFLHENQSLHKNLLEIQNIPSDILLEVGVSFESLKNIIKERLLNLNKKYWSILFNEMDEIKRRLITENRYKFSELLATKQNVDFNEENIYHVVEQILIKSNNLKDSQFIKVYEGFFSTINFEKYKSNNKVFVEDKSEYVRSYMKDFGEVKMRLGNRIIKEYAGLDLLFSTSKKPRISQSTEVLFNNLSVIAHGLGFNVEDGIEDIDGKNHVKYFLDTDGTRKVLFSAVSFKSKTTHFKFYNDFIHAMNIQYGKLKGWIRDYVDAAREFGVSEDFAQKIIKNSQNLTLSSVRLLV